MVHLQVCDSLLLPELSRRSSGIRSGQPQIFRKCAAVARGGVRTCAALHSALRVGGTQEWPGQGRRTSCEPNRGRKACRPIGSAVHRSLGQNGSQRERGLWALDPKGLPGLEKRRDPVAWGVGWSQELSSYSPEDTKQWNCWEKQELCLLTWNISQPLSTVLQIEWISLTLPNTPTTNL